VPDLVEEIELTADETGIDREYLTFVLSEWDAQALKRPSYSKTRVAQRSSLWAWPTTLRSIRSFTPRWQRRGRGGEDHILECGRSSGSAGLRTADRAAVLAAILPPSLPTWS